MGWMCFVGNRRPSIGRGVSMVDVRDRGTEVLEILETPKLRQHVFEEECKEVMSASGCITKLQQKTHAAFFATTTNYCRAVLR